MEEDGWEILHPSSFTPTSAADDAADPFLYSEILSNHFTADSPVIISISDSRPDEAEYLSPTRSYTPALSPEIEPAGDETLADGEEDERSAPADETDRFLQETLEEMETVNRYLLAKMEEIACVGNYKEETDMDQPVDKEEEKSDQLAKSEAGAVWWNLPIELFKFCSFGMRPVWTVSIAAAFVGIVILGRRMHRMKNKSRTIPIKIAMDDKKASQLMTRVGKLNEAFSLVKSVALIRPSIPVGSVSELPVLRF